MLLVVTILVTFTLWTSCSLSFVLPLEFWGQGTAGILLFDAAVILFTVRAALKHWHILDSRIFTQFVTVLFLAQILFDILTTLGIFAGFICWLFRGGVFSILGGGELAWLYPAEACLLGVYSVFIEPYTLQEHVFQLPVDNLPEELVGYKIAQISDFHLGPCNRVEELRKLLEKVAAAKPDVLAITGDLFDDATQDEAAAKLVDSFVDRFPQGIWYIRGNHEYMKGIEPIEGYIQKTRLHELINSAGLVKDASRPLWFVGLDYPIAQGVITVKNTHFCKEAYRNVPEDALTVLLTHHPSFFDDGRKYGPFLTLAGHTHGGQVGAFGVSLVPGVYKYNRGMYQVGNQYCYVHRGNGGRIPYRLGCSPEIAYFILKPAEKK